MGLAFAAAAWSVCSCAKARLRDSKKAVEYGFRACELSNWKDPFCLGTLAAAYAEAGKFPEAVKWQSRALDFPEIYSKSATDLARQRLLLYEAHKPYHEGN